MGMTAVLDVVVYRTFARMRNGMGWRDAVVNDSRMGIKCELRRAAEERSTRSKRHVPKGGKQVRAATRRRRPKPTRHVRTKKEQICKRIFQGEGKILGCVGGNCYRLGGASDDNIIPCASSGFQVKRLRASA